MRISVLIPVYNTEKYLSRCIESVLNQSFTDFELLLVDDGSTDGSGIICDEYATKDNRIRVFHKENGGVSSARNLGLNNAQGDFVCWIDSDDWLAPDAFELLFEQQMETSADMVSGNMRVHTQTGVEDFFEPHYENKEQMVLKQLPSTYDHNLVRRIIRRSLFEEHHIRCIDRADMGEDRFLMAQICYYARKVSNIDFFVYHYEKRNAQSITSQIQSKKVLSRLEQELVNWIGIIDFFEDKEEIYVQTSLDYTVECAQMTIKFSLKYHDKECFFRVVDCVLTNENLKTAMGWNKKCAGIIGRNYHLMLAKSFVNRFLGAVRRILNRKRRLHLAY